LEGNTRRAIDIHEGEKVDAGAFKALVKAAVAQNGPPAKKRSELRRAAHARHLGAAGGAGAARGGVPPKAGAKQGSE
jgi:hypothetical protein